MQPVTRELSYLTARQVGAFKGFTPKTLRDIESLRRIGIAGFDLPRVRQMQTGMDAIQPTITTPSIATPIQFLQAWMPGFVYIITQARKIDDLIGLATIGQWEMEQVVQGILERIGAPQIYGDYTNVPLSSWNTNFDTRTIVRFEEGMQIGQLEAARAAMMQVDDAGAKREAAAEALEIARNTVGFFGFNNGANRTFGFLNDPNEPSYVTVANGAGGSPLWSTKTYLEINKDIRAAIATLQTQSGDTIDPEKVDITLAVATSAYQYLSVTSDFGNSVRDWLTDTFPRIRIVSAPQLNTANGGAAVFYLYADAIQDRSTDDGRTFVQMVPTKFQMLGVEQKAKSYIEDYSNATAGVMCKRPYAMVRRSGI